MDTEKYRLLDPTDSDWVIGLRKFLHDFSSNDFNSTETDQFAQEFDSTSLPPRKLVWTTLETALATALSLGNINTLDDFAPLLK